MKGEELETMIKNKFKKKAILVESAGLWTALVVPGKQEHITKSEKLELKTSATTRRGSK